MKTVNPEAIKNTSKEADLSVMVKQAEQMTLSEEMEAQEANDEAMELQLILQQAQAAHEKKEEAERQGKETRDKVEGVTGGM